MHFQSPMKEDAERHVMFEDGGALRITAGDVDPRGWQLLCSDGGVFGTVTGLVADQENLRISHLVSDVYTPTPHRVLLPAPFARFDQENHSVIYDALTRETAELLPTFSGLPIDPAVQDHVLALLTHTEPTESQTTIQTASPVDRRKGQRRRH